MMQVLQITLMAATLTLMTSAAFSDDPDYQPVAGEVIEFDVYRGDSRFGSHEIVFDWSNDVLVTEATIRLRAGLGPITLFRYEHDAREEWRDGKLVYLESRTLKDGDRLEVQINRDENLYEVDRSVPDLSASLELAASLLPSSHWHGYPVSMKSMVNTETGERMDVEMTFIGREEIEADGGTIIADRYRLEGSLVLDLWYDENGRWAGCEFEARGQRIRYVRRSNPLDL